MTLTESELRDRLVAIWCEVLLLATPDADADFLELNGSSLDAVRILNRVHAVLGRDDLEVAMIFDFSTPRALATALTR